MAEGKPQSWKFTVGDKTHSVTVINGEVSGMGTEDEKGRFKPIDPSSNEFATLSENEAVLNAISRDKFNGQEGKVTETALQDTELLKQNYDKAKKTYDNESQIAEEQATFYGQDQFSGAQYAGLKDVETLRYPYDMDIEQDHLKITQYEYKRLQSFKEGLNVFQNNVQGSRPNYKGDSMKGKPFGPYKGGVILPMPKVSDSNGAEWGKSDLNVFGLTAVSGAASFVNAFDPRQTADSDKFGMKDLFGKLFGSEDKELSDAENAEAYRNNLNKEFGMGDRVRNTGFAGLGIAAQEIGKLAGLDITADEFLARSTGTILNPNAELLFQGPVLRDFGFKFLMVARSEAEAKTIREIIRFFKIGSAANFLGGPALLGTPNVFQLEYKAGENSLETVNKFNAMALRTITVDYAPDGFWSAYQDSHPVAVVMSLQFSELKPIYRTDHETTSVGSVGY
jgi:hypothetical protein